MGDAEVIGQLKGLIREYRKLVRHCWVHSGYPDCGYKYMATEQKDLYCRTIGRSKSEQAEIDATIAFREMRFLYPDENNYE